MKKLILIILLLYSVTGVGVYYGFQYTKTLHQEVNTYAINESYDDMIGVLSNKVVEAQMDEEERKKTLKLDLYGKYELPLKNSMGISISSIKAKAEASNDSETIASLSGGDTFLILEEALDGAWLYVDLGDGKKAYVESIKTLINLPDIIPSIEYKITNSDASIFRSSGYPLENITGYKKYDVMHYNDRLNKDEYVVPVVYPMAVKIQKAQSMALKNNHTLVIYESYRPYTLQREVVTSLQSLVNSNVEVKEGITSGSWSMTWFISNGISNHQRGAAIDVSLAKVIQTERITVDGVEYNDIREVDEYVMQSPMHELSIKSTSLDVPVSSMDETAWKNVGTNAAMTEFSILLRDYMVNSGLTPIASEWWHFNDLPSITALKATGINFATSLKFNKCISESYGE